MNHPMHAPHIEKISNSGNCCNINLPLAFPRVTCSSPTLVTETNEERDDCHVPAYTSLSTDPLRPHSNCPLLAAHHPANPPAGFQDSLRLPPQNCLALPQHVNYTCDHSPACNTLSVVPLDPQTLQINFQSAHPQTTNHKHSHSISVDPIQG